eukprot:TRINITY_DN10194_c0_g1_i1.p1 TRINITY_DN10194_c0_g1~~TRINITY_DN10194_c0_g1_i1.p1  ORF type:complete len:618 (+),score=161.12 TRINITY_DN10194_c0_g1_i1:61-1854(+)
MLRHWRYVDEVIEDAPWTVTAEFVRKYNIDWVVGCDENSDDGYKNVRELGRFIPIERTEGISTSHIIMRIVRDYDEFVKFNLSKGYSGKDMNVGLLKEKSLLMEHKIQKFKEKVKENFKQKVDLVKEDVKEDLGRIRRWWTEQHLAVDFLKKFGEKKWFEKRSLMLGVLKVMAIVRQGDKRAKKAILPVEESFRLELYLLCCQHVPGWKSIPSYEFHCAPLTGGLTNQLFRCWITPDGALHPTSPLSTFPTSPNYITYSPPNAQPSPPNSALSTTTTTTTITTSQSPNQINPTTVLVRMFGEHSFFDREKENTIFNIFSELGFGPKLYGIFEKGRIEEFIFARTLLLDDLPKPLLSGLIAKKLAVMHSFDMPFPAIPSLFESLSNWLQAARAVSFPNDFIKDRIVKEMNLEALDEEVEKLQILLESLNSPIVFCHNDLQEGNIMWDQADENIRFIDFEYGNYNYRGFDIANHFCEWMFDYSKQEYPYFTTEPGRYPTETQMKHFLRNYLTVVKTSSGPSTTVEIPISDVDEREVDALMMEARCFTLASHLLWAMWGIIQAKSSEIEFGFLEYSAARFREYYRLSAVLYPNISLRSSD